jgi:hypothetical protein
VVVLPYHPSKGGIAIQAKLGKNGNNQSKNEGREGGKEEIRLGD